MKLHYSTLCMAAAVLSACSMAPKYQQPNVDIPTEFRHGDTQPERLQAADLGWQDYFADPRLSRLIELALQHNPDLRIVALNTEAVRKQYLIARADLLPSLTATGTGTRARVAEDLSSAGRSAINTSYSVGLGAASYELDLWGRVTSLKNAALNEYFSSAATRDAARLSLIASVAKAYFNQRYAEESMALAQKVLKIREQTYELVKLKHRAGVLSALDVRQNEALIESAKADYAQAVQAKEQAENALAVLINAPLPDNLPAPLPLAQQFKVERLPAGVPSEVLLKRPDVRSAEFALKQANANIGAARAALFPAIRLTGSIGTGSTELSGLFKSGNGTWSFMPTITLPIFTWGQNKANLDISHLRKNIAVATYEKTVQAAFQDVADALSARESLEKQYQANAKQSAAYAEALRLVKLRYQHGVSSSMEWLDAERSSYAAQAGLLTTQRSMLENLADLYKALGGGLKDRTAEPSA